MNSGAQLHQGIDGDGIVRDMTAYLEGALSVVRRRLPLVFPNDQSGPNSNVRSFILVSAYAPRTCTCDPASTSLCHYFCTLHKFFMNRAPSVHWIFFPAVGNSDRLRFASAGNRLHTHMSLYSILLLSCVSHITCCRRDSISFCQ
jgi:hypothetical protein